MKEKKVKTFVGKKNWLSCNRCRRRTSHTCKVEHFPLEAIDVSEVLFLEEKGLELNGIGHFYRLWTCDGCQDAILEECWDGCKITDSKGKSWYEEPNEVEYHPHRTERSVPVKNYVNLPKEVANVYYETVFAHHHSLYLLCGVGLRVLVEAICSNQGIEGKNLSEKINGLKKLLPAAIAQKFHALRLVGNQAAHEFKEPQLDDLHLGIQICEDMLNFLYELDHRASRLERNLKSKTTVSTKY